MSKVVIAVTVSEFYLDPSIYSVKLLSVATRADGTPVWRVVRSIHQHAEFSEAEKEAKSYSLQKGIPYVEDVRRGERLTAPQKLRLYEYGFNVDTILDERGKT